MYKNYLLTYFILIVIVGSSISCLIYLLFNQNKILDGYNLIIFFPIAYLICYYFLIHKILIRYGISIFLVVYITVSFFRYIVLSVLVVESQWFFGRSYNTPSSESFETAILLMIYEIFIYSISIYIFHRKLIPENQNLRTNIKFPNQTLVYFLFLIFVAGLTIIRPNALNYFSFFSINDSIISISDVDALTSLVSILLNIAKLLIVFILITYIHNIFHEKSILISFILISIIIAMNIFIYFGANRSDFIFNAIASVILLLYLYKKLGLAVAGILVATIPMIINSITGHRQTTTITNGANALIDLTDLLQVYLAGIYNVALGVEISKLYSFINPLYAVLDILRSAIGPNIILGNYDIFSSTVVFNERIFSSGLVSQIIPMISQGQFYLGFILSPLIGIFFIYIAIYLTKILMRSKRIELIFLFTLFSGRLGFVMAQNGNILINELTFFLPTFLLIYFLNNKITYGDKL